MKTKRTDQSIKWFEFDLQQKAITTRGLSYDIELEPQIKELQETKSPVKITKFGKRKNMYTCADDIQIKRSTLLQPSKQLFSYKAVPNENTNAEFLDICAIKVLPLKTMVSLVCYINPIHAGGRGRIPPRSYNLYCQFFKNGHVMLIFRHF